MFLNMIPPEQSEGISSCLQKNNKQTKKKIQQKKNWLFIRLDGGQSSKVKITVTYLTNVYS